MVYQSNIRLAEGEKAKVEKVKEGVYVIANAYEGQYEYFKSPKQPTQPAPLPSQSEAEVHKE